MSEEETKRLLKENFQAAVDPPAVMDGCLSLCKTFNFTGEELYFQWQAYSYGLGGHDKRISEERLQPFRDHLQRNLQRGSTVNKKRATDGARVGGPARALPGKSALASRMLANAAGSTPRRDVAVKMEDSGAGPVAGASTTRNRIVPSERTNGFTYRYLQDKLLQKGETLNRRIDEFGSYVKEYYGLEELADPNVATEDDVYIIGRICDDSESKLTEANILLEPSKAVGEGDAKRIPLPDLEMTVDDLFLRKIAVPIRNYILGQQPDLSVAFMPGVRDLVSFHNVYPQSSVMGPENFRSWKPQQGTPPWSFLSNPGIFSIHGLTFGATSVDVLFHLRRQEVFKALPGAVQQDPMAGLCRHILDQRSFYPIYPVPFDNSQEVNLDVSHSHLLSIPNDSIPDVVVLPSRLKEFSKIVDGTVFINPSSATKFNNPGMLAKITVNAMLEGTERISVDLVKL
ncbi:DNA-directed DNA polymerase alpha subunit pol12 [Tulasnella sp. 417]|nr:DNA-directed DNA polymerase alpha subunit pol12 [Tulasnella sp. 417]